MVKPVRPSERWRGQKSLEKRLVGGFRTIHQTDYRGPMQNPKGKKGPAASGTSKRLPRSAYGRAEIEEIFRRFSVQRPEPKGELEHVNPFTLLVAVVLSAQATDVGVNRATAPLFQDRRQAGDDAGASARRRSGNTSVPSASGATRRRTSSALCQALIEKAWRGGAGGPRPR